MTEIMNALPSLYLACTFIRQDGEGRYCLNDLHKAAGELPRHKPVLFLRLEGSKRLVALLEKRAKGGYRSVPTFNSISIVSDGPNELRGTFVAWQLVYAYAMWISAEFHLLVIETFHDSVIQDRRKVSAQLARTEAAYFARYPERRVIRKLALEGEPYWYIGRAVRRAAATVGKAVRHMIAWGLIDARHLAICRQGSLRIMSEFRRKQAGLDFA
jgi:hypothetical protein